MAKKLLSLTQIYGKETDDGARIDLKLSQQELGNLVGTSRESINKQMRSWEEEGIISVDRGRITIRRVEELENLTIPF